MRGPLRCIARSGTCGSNTWSRCRAGPRSCVECQQDAVPGGAAGPTACSPDRCDRGLPANAVRDITAGVHRLRCPALLALRGYKGRSVRGVENPVVDALAHCSLRSTAPKSRRTHRSTSARRLLMAGSSSVRLRLVVTMSGFPPWWRPLMSANISRRAKSVPTSRP